MNITCWTALGAMGTFAMAIATFLSLRAYKKKEKRIEKRELMEGVVQPLLQNLNSLIALGFHNFSPIQGGFQWQRLKSKNPWVVFKIDEYDKSLRAELDGFGKEVDELPTRANVNWRVKFNHIATKRVFSKVGKIDKDIDRSNPPGNLLYIWTFMEGGGDSIDLETLILRRDLSLGDEVKRSQLQHHGYALEEEYLSVEGHPYHDVRIRQMTCEIIEEIRKDFAEDPDLVKDFNVFREMKTIATKLKTKLEAVEKRLSK